MSQRGRNANRRALFTLVEDEAGRLPLNHFATKLSNIAIHCWLNNEGTYLGRISLKKKKRIGRWIFWTSKLIGRFSFLFFYFIGGLLRALRINIVDENLFLIPFFLVFYEFYEDFNGEWRRICIFVRDDSVEKNYCKITFVITF